MAEDTITVQVLSDAEAQKLGETHPELISVASALVIAGEQRTVAAIKELLHRFVREEDRSERLLAIMTESAGAGVPEESRVMQLYQQAGARDQFLKEFDTVTSQKIAETNRSTARNTAALASRWKSDGKIFALNVGRTDKFPAFQFGDDGKPLPVIAQVIHILQDRSPWSLALWFASNNGWLGGERPVDLILTRPDDVVEAARQSIRPIAV